MFNRLQLFVESLLNDGRVTPEEVRRATGMTPVREVSATIVVPISGVVMVTPNRDDVINEIAAMSVEGEAHEIDLDDLVPQEVEFTGRRTVHVEGVPVPDDVSATDEFEVEEFLLKDYVNGKVEYLEVTWALV